MVVDQGLQPQTSLVYCFFLTGKNHVRCQSSRMGSPLLGPSGPGTLAFPITRHSLKHSGAQTCLLSPPSIQFIPQREKCPTMHGQQSGGSLHIETRWHQEPHTHEGSTPYPRLGTGTFDKPEGGISSSSTEPTRRRSKQNLYFEQ